MDKKYSWVTTHKEIVDDPIQSMIEDYKTHIAETQLKDEKFKWELIEEYKGRPNLDAEDILEEIKSINYSNLMFHLSKAVMNELSEKHPEEIRKLFVELFDESIDLTKRVKDFSKNTKLLYKKLGKTDSHHQDERAISTYLTFRYPEKYTFYKHAFYKSYCDLLKIKQAKKNEKYALYLLLIDELIEKYIAPNSELIEQVKSYIPQYYGGENHKLLAQDILYQMLDKNTKINYWVFQGNPAKFDFEAAMKDDVIDSWTVTAHKDKIKEGDKVIIWLTGESAGCYALAEVTSKPYERQTAVRDDKHWKEENKNNVVADIEITHNLMDNPLLKDDMSVENKLNDLNVGNQGTNFSATEKEYNAILELAMNKEDLINYREDFIKWLQNKYGDNSGTINSYVKAIDILSNILSVEIFKNDDVKYFEDLYKDLIREQRSKESRYYHPDAPSYGSNGFYSASIKSYIDFIMSKQKPVNYPLNYPLNTIFYGPPGTGKTYNTVLRAAEIIEDREIKDYKEALDIFNAHLHNQIEFITFHQNYSYEDFIQGIRPDTDNNEELTFEKRDGVFKKIADRALKNLKESEKPTVYKKTFEEAFNQLLLPLTEGEVEEIEVKMKRVSYYITAVTDKSIDFRKASGGTAHTMSIATLGRMYEAESVLDILGLTSYYAPLLDELLRIGKDASGKKNIVEKKNYVIIIDEINRANISRVFGELITLIEPDKRSHGEIPLVTQLPSGDKFLVPSNLYIVGTMNTADKSIALLDIALRRRFEFEAMYPLYDIEGKEIHDVDILEKLNKKIVETKGYDFQIGHSFFMNSNEDSYELTKRMNNKVIPLLLEYYMNDDKEVRAILQSAGLMIEENQWPLRVTGKNDQSI